MGAFSQMMDRYVTDTKRRLGYVPFIMMIPAVIAIIIALFVIF